MKGFKKKESSAGSPEELAWNHHVDSGECKRKKAAVEGKLPEGPEQCEKKGCKAKLTQVGRYHCSKCGIHTCLSHRYEDAHECKFA